MYIVKRQAIDMRSSKEFNTYVSEVSPSGFSNKISEASPFTERQAKNVCNALQTIESIHHLRNKELGVIAMYSISQKGATK